MTKSTVPLLTEADAALRRFGELWRRGRDGSVEPEKQEQLLRAEARIAEERRRYHELFEFGPDGYLVTTGTAVIRESNRMAATLLGVPTSSLFSKPLSVFVHIDRRIAFRTLLNTMAAGEMTTQTLETVIVRRGGTTFPAVLRVIAARSPRTSTVELRWTLRDVTGERAVQRDLLAQIEDRKRIEESLQRPGDAAHAGVCGARAHRSPSDRSRAACPSKAAPRVQETPGRPARSRELL